MIGIVDIIGVPMDLGADRRGVDMGPSALRYARLREALQQLGYTVEERGNLSVPQAESTPQGNAHAKYLETIQSVCIALADAVADAMRAGHLPIVLGGDHAIAMGTRAGIRRVRGRAAGTLWIDAHADINAPVTSPSGNVHGMPVWYALEAGDLDPHRFAYIGLRAVDPGERAQLRERGIRAYTMADVDQRGINAVVEEALALTAAGPGSLHVSLDMDALDPREAPGVGTPERGGLTYREAHAVMEAVAASGALGSLEVSEVNPILDERNQTAILAVELVRSALGATVL